MSLPQVISPALKPITPFSATEFFNGDLEKVIFREIKSKTTPKPNHERTVDKLS